MLVGERIVYQAEEGTSAQSLSWLLITASVQRPVWLEKGAGCPGASVKGGLEAAVRTLTFPE